MAQPVKVGLYKLQHELKLALDAFGALSFTPTELNSEENFESFLLPDRRSQGKLLVADAQQLSAVLMETLVSHSNDRAFRAIVYGHGPCPFPRSAECSSRFVYQLTPSDITMSASFIKTIADELFLEIQDSCIKHAIESIRNAYEQLYTTEQHIPSRPARLLKSIRDLIHAQVVSVYLWNSENKYYNLEFNAGGHPPREIEDVNGPPELVSTYKTDVFVGRESWPSYIGSLAAISHLQCAAVTRFHLDEISGFVLYGLPGPVAPLFLSEVCHFASREIFHSIRGTRIRSQHEVLKSIWPAPSLRVDRNEAIWNALELIKKYFVADGVSLVELLETDADSFTFKKTLIHRDRREVERFNADHGYAVEVLLQNQALIISHTDDHSSPPSGRGLIFDIDHLETGKGKPITIPYYKTSKTVEDEKSLMYFPFVVGDQITAGIKVGDFERSRVYDLRHLIDLQILSAPLRSLLVHVRLEEELRTRAANSAFQERFGQKAETLFFYRDIALGVFHQLGNHIRTLRSTLALLEIKLSQESLRRDDILVDLKDASNYSDLALDLISDAHKRGLTLTPIPKNCRLIADVLRPAVEYAKDRLRGSDIKLNHSLGDQDYDVVLDPKLAKEAIINVITNAIWAVKEHKHAGKKEIFIAFREEPPGVGRIEITDSGIGMDRPIFEQVARFLPFVTFRKGGTGLGLYFSQQMLEHFDGKISIIRSQPLKGTTVVITIHVSER